MLKDQVLTRQDWCLMGADKNILSVKAATIHQNSLEALLTVAAYRNYDFKTIDVVGAFLYANLPKGTVLFAELPDGHPDVKNRVAHDLRIEKSLYGLKEAPSLWFNHLRSNLLGIGLRPAT